MYYLAKRMYEDGILTDEEISEFIQFIDKIVEELKKSIKVVIMETPLICIKNINIQAMTYLLINDDIDEIVKEIKNSECNYNTLYLYGFDIFKNLDEVSKIIIRMGKKI